MFKEDAQWNAFFSFLLISIGLFFWLFLASPKFLIIAIYVAGLAFFFIAKCSQFQKRKWTSFGTSGMSKIFRNLYWAGYFLMGASTLIAFGKIISQRY